MSADTRDKIKVERQASGYTFVTVTRKSEGLRVSATYRAPQEEDGIATAHARAIAKVDEGFAQIMGEVTA